MKINLEFPHRRFNPLTREWVLVSPHRARRPWLGQVEKVPPEILPAYDPDCYLCPTNQRAGGRRNPNYATTYVFDNDFPALLPPESMLEGVSKAAVQLPDSPLFVAQPSYGINRVVCFSPRHDLTLPELSQSEVELVVAAWCDQTRELSAVDYIGYIQIFENKGAMMGCSNPHPHSQIWATGHIPDLPAKELSNQNAYWREGGSCMLCEYLSEEERLGERVVLENESFLALVPFWAVWPFEVMLLPKRHLSSLMDLSASEVGDLASILRGLTARYDNLFEVSFPYSMGFHQVPTRQGLADHAEPSITPEEGSESWHLHAHYYPPLLRSATVRKFMVGFEMLGMPQRDLTPEAAAKRLRGLSEQHYKQKAQ